VRVIGTKANKQDSRPIQWPLRGSVEALRLLALLMLRPTFLTDHALSGGKSRLDILRHVHGIQFFDKPLLRHSQT
jgi:hypothetical protein